MINECADWHVIVASVATNVAETTQSATWQPAVVVTVNISTLRQSQIINTDLHSIADQRLIWTTAQIAHETHSRDTVDDWKFTVLNGALWKKFRTVN